jgi:hypothetical protein
MYLVRAGFLDGAVGVIVAALASMSVAAKYARLWELQRRGSGTEQQGLGTGDSGLGKPEHGAENPHPVSSATNVSR